MEENIQNPVQQPKKGQPPIATVPLQPSTPEQKQMETPPPKKKFPLKITIVVLVVVLLIGSGSGLFYFLRFRKIGLKPEQQKQKEVTTQEFDDKGLCRSEDFPQPQIRYPRSDNSTLVFSITIDKDFNLEINSLAFRGSGGGYDILFDRETERKIIIQIQDSNGKVLKQMRDDPQFSMPADPGTPIQLAETIMNITSPYPWEARKIVFRTDEKLLKEVTITTMLLRGAFTMIPAEAYLIPQEGIILEFEKILNDIEICLDEGKEIKAARLLEFHLLPKINSSLDDNFKKDEILQMDKSEVVDLIEELTARLDPSLVTASLPPSLTGVEYY